MSEALCAIALLPLLAAILSAGGLGEWWWQSRGWVLLLETLAFAGVAGLTALLAGAALAGTRGPWLFLACIPLVLPASLVGSAWALLLGRAGPLGDWFSVFDWPVAAAVVGLRYAGLAGLLLLGQNASEGGRLASRVFVVRHAWWHLGVRARLKPWAIAWAVVTLWIAAEPILPSMFLVHTYATQMLVQYNALLDPAGAAALALPMILIGGVVLAFVVRSGAATVKYWRTSKREARARSRAVGVALCLVATGLPLTGVFLALPAWPTVVASMQGTTPELFNSVFLAVLVTPICVASGWCVASAWSRRARERTTTLAPWTLLTLVVPGPLLALGWLQAQAWWPDRAAVDGTFWLALAVVARLLPVAALVLWLDLRRHDAGDDAARLMVSSTAARWRRVTWPTHRRVLACTAALCFVLVIAELELSLLLAPPGRSTVSVRLYTLIHTAPDGQVAAAALAVLLLVLPVVAWLLVWLPRREA